MDNSSASVTDTTSTAQANSSFDPELDGEWQTVEQAAVALGLSVRTVNRHISADKLKSKLTDGRREVFVPRPAASSPDATAKTRSSPPAAAASESTAPSVQPSEQNSASSVSDRSFSHGGQANRVGEPSSQFNMETALARADNAADKAELAVTAYQTLARSIETQAVSARRMARVAWSIVGVFSVAIAVAIGWTANRLTRAEIETKDIQRQATSASQTAETRAAELNALQQKLSDAQQQAARAEGRAAVLTELQSHPAAPKPTTRPGLIDRLSTAFGGP